MEPSFDDVVRNSGGNRQRIRRFLKGSPCQTRSQPQSRPVVRHSMHSDYVVLRRWRRTRRNFWDDEQRSNSFSVETSNQLAARDQLRLTNADAMWIKTYL